MYRVTNIGNIWYVEEYRGHQWLVIATRANESEAREQLKSIKREW